MTDREYLMWKKRQEISKLKRAKMFCLDCDKWSYQMRIDALEAELAREE